MSWPEVAIFIVAAWLVFFAVVLAIARAAAINDRIDERLHQQLEWRERRRGSK